MFTTGLVAAGERRVALFFTGRQHAGENLMDVLRKRAADLPPPVVMCDALTRNVPKGVNVLLANCNAHGRRQFVEVADNFPPECRFVLEKLGEVYGIDAEARERGLGPAARLALHQERSGPLMAELRKWCDRQLGERLVEPNSGFGQGDPVSRESLGETDAVSAAGGGSAGQQHLRAGAEEGGAAPKECAVLPDAAWGGGGGSVHEPDP